MSSMSVNFRHFAFSSVPPSDTGSSRNTQQVVAPEGNANCGREEGGMTEQANDMGDQTRRTRRVGHVTCVMEGKGCKLGLERGHIGDLGADGRKVLKVIFK